MANEIACYHHPSQQAVAQCGKCGKDICNNCYDGYEGVCYDCAMKVADVTRDNALTLMFKVMHTRKWMIIWSVIGGVIGLIIGIAKYYDGIAYEGVITVASSIIFTTVFGICVGSSIVTIWAAIKAVYRAINNSFIGKIFRKCYHFFYRNKNQDTKDTWNGILFIILFIPILMIIVGLFCISPIVSIVSISRFFKQKKQIAEYEGIALACNSVLEKQSNYHNIITNM